MSEEVTETTETTPEATVENQPDPVEPKTFDESYVKKLRDEAASYRTKLRETEERTTTVESQLQGIAKALGFANENEAADPDLLQKQLEESQTELANLRRTNALRDAASEHDADVALLIPYLKGTGALDAIDPSDTEAINNAVKEAVDSNSKLRATPGGKPSDADQGPRKASGVNQLTREDIQSMTPAQIDAAREAGKLDKLLGRI